MPHAVFRFYGPLNDFLPPDRRQVAFVQPFVGRPAVKDTIEAVGVPHPEVDVVLVDGEPVGFGHPLDDGVRVAVYPSFRSIDLDGIAARTGAVEGEPAFVLDGHLGRLARALRMLGFDTWYRADADDPELAEVAAGQDRILLTRDRGLLRRSIIRRGAFVRSDRPSEQLADVVERFELAPRARPLTRCIRCNGVLVDATLREVVDRLEPLTKRFYTEFRRCPECGAVYWRGSHHRRMGAVIDAAVGAEWRDR